MSHPSNHPILCSWKKNLHDFHFPPLEFSLIEFFYILFYLFDLPGDGNLAPRRFAPSTVDGLPIASVGSLAMVQGHPLSFYKVFATQKLFCLLNLSCTGGLARKKVKLRMDKSWMILNRRHHEIPSCVMWMWMWMVCFFVESNCWRKDIQGTPSKFFRDGKLWINVKKINQ